MKVIRTLLTTTTAIAFLGGSALPVTAQEAAGMSLFGPDKGDWEISLNAGGSNDNDFDSGGFNGGFSVGYYMTENVSLSLRQGLNYFDTGASSVWGGSTRGAVDYHFDLDRFRPFVGANFGGYYGRRINDTWAAGLEAGAKYYVKAETFLFVMGEYQWAFNDVDRADNNFSDGQFVYSAGIGFNF